MRQNIGRKWAGVHSFQGSRCGLAGLAILAALLAAACSAPSPFTAPHALREGAATPLASLRQEPSSSLVTPGAVDAEPTQAITATLPGQADVVPLLQPARDNDIRFERLSVSDGLSQSSVYCILQDSKGFMWFGTGDGLNKYDGYRFWVYKHDPDDPHSLRAGEIGSIYEDKAGMLWIPGSGASIDRYDRDTDRFTHYLLSDPNDPEAASSDFVWTVYEDSAGTLWVGTYRSGLHRYDRGADSFVHFRHDADDPRSLSDNRVYAIYEDQAGVLWVGTKGGLNRLDRETNRFTHYRHDPDDPQSLGSDIVQLIFEDHAGRFWVTTFGVGLEQVNRETGRVVARYQHDPNDPQSIDVTDRVLDVYEDRAGMLWVTHFDRRLDRFDPETGVFTRFRHDANDRSTLSSDNVFFVAEDRSGNLWMGTADGLDRYDPETGQFVHYRNDPNDAHSLSSNQAISFYQDRGGVLWIGSEGRGLSYHDPRWTKFAHYRINPGAIEDNMVTAIYQDRAGMLWIGTSTGLHRYDQQSGAFQHYRYTPDDPYSLSAGWVLSIYQDRAGTLWVGTEGGLDRFDPVADRFIRYEQAPPDEFNLGIGAVYSIVQDQSGMLWLGRHRQGLCQFDPERGQCIDYVYAPSDSLNPHNMVRQVYEDQDDVLWVGTLGGLHKFDQALGTWTSYVHQADDPQSLSNDQVMCIYQDRSGMLWLGTREGGLNSFDRTTETFAHFTEKDGLPSNTILGIVEDEGGDLWLSTSNGVSRYDPRTGAFRNYDASDGLQANEFLPGAYFQDSSGQIFFGGIDGFSAFYPADVKDNPYVPPVVLTSLTQGGEAIVTGKAAESLSQVSFKWPRNFFEFEFAALSYSRPEKNQYAYMLEGFDSGWNYTGSRRLGKYTNLPGRTYTLRVKGSNSDGAWNQEGLSVQVTVVPPFWETWWFRGAIAVLVVASAIGGYRQRVQNIEMRNRELENQVATRTKRLAALNAIASVVSRSLELKHILADALDKTLEVMGLEAGGIYLLEGNVPPGSDGILRIAAHRGLDVQLVEGIDRLVVGEGFSGRVVERGEPLVVHDLHTDLRLTRSVVKESGFRSLAISPIVSRSKVIGTLFVMTRADAEFSQQDVELLNSIAGQIGVAIENARFFEAEQRRAEQFRVIAEVGRRITLTPNTDQVLTQVVRLVQHALGYYHVGIGLVEGDEVVYRVGAGTLSDDPQFQIRPARLKLGEEGLTGWVAASGEPLLVPDVSQEPRYVWMEGSQTRSELLVPITVKGQVIGVLDVQSDHLNAFDDTDLSVLQSLAHQTGAAIENAWLYEQAQQVAVMEERQRLARELHDAVTQTLFSASLIAEALPASWENDAEVGRQLLRELRQLSKGALAEMRTLLLELRPAALVETSLRDLLRQLAEAATGRTGVPVTVSVQGECRVPADVHIALYRIAQEALNNVVKHSRATQVTVELSCSGPASRADGGEGQRRVELRVCDDGRGFDLQAAPSDRLGLGIMRERAQTIGATLTIDSQPGCGTQMVVVWQRGG